MFVSTLAVLTILALWFMKKRQKVSSKSSIKKVKGPFAAVKIKRCMEACAQVMTHSDKLFLISEAPGLPLKDCDRVFDCNCRFIHFADRRQGEDRRSHSVVLQSVFRGEELRGNKKRGRRRDD